MRTMAISQMVLELLRTTGKLEHLLNYAIIGKMKKKLSKNLPNSYFPSSESYQMRI